MLNGSRDASIPAVSNKNTYMEYTLSLIEPLLEKAEKFSKTSIELLKLKSVYKTSDIASTLISRLLLIVIILFFLLSLNVGIALWLGDLLGKNYYGFLLVASFYGLLGIVLFFLHPTIKASVNNSIIIKLLK